MTNFSIAEMETITDLRRRLCALKARASRMKKGIEEIALEGELAKFDGLVTAGHMPRKGHFEAQIKIIGIKE